MRSLFQFGVLAAGMMVQSGYGQSLADQTSFKNMSLGGIHLYGVSVFSGYSTSAYPGGPGQFQADAGILGADVDYGASASLGWQHHRDRSNFSMLYSGTYAGMVRYSGSNAFSQGLSLAFSRTLSPKWSLAIAGIGSDSTVAQLLFQPSNIGVISQVPASFDDLAAAFSIGQFSSSQVGSTLTGPRTLDSPARALLLGSRMLSYSGQMSLGYAATSRLSFHLSSFTAGGQHRRGGNSPQDTSYVMPHSLGLTGGVGFVYMFSPRTQMGFDAGVNRLMNRYQKAYVSNANVSIGRKMGMHWFLRAYGGGSLTRSTAQPIGTPSQRAITGGGSIGFRTYRHTLVGTYDRSSMDAYGFTVGVNTSLTAAWTWHRPGSSWNVFTSFGQEQVRNTGYASLSGLQAGGGVMERLNGHMQLSAQYVYMNNTGGYLGNVTNLAIHGVRVSMSWSPQEATH